MSEVCQTSRCPAHCSLVILPRLSLFRSMWVIRKPYATAVLNSPMHCPKHPFSRLIMCRLCLCAV